MKKNVLILGSGGREHALAWKLSESENLAQLFVLPGNPGTMSVAINIPGDLSDIPFVIHAIRQFDIDVVVCGPEAPLDAGIMDAISQTEGLHKLILVGPGKKGAQLESSKAFSKDFMQKHGIPTAAYKIFQKNQLNDAMDYISNLIPPIVLKASGLAAGKGVVICEDHMEAEKEIISMLSGKFGTASETLVIEEFMSGIEFSVFVLTNGKQYVLLPEAKDYKRIGEGDTGPNTGGMGAISPVPFADQALMDRVKREIIEPTLKGLQADEIPYQGFIFFGLMKVGEQPKVIEYNCRLGDPETEVILPRIESDLLELFMDMQAEKLQDSKIEISPKTAATIVLASGGYPGSFEKGKPIELKDEFIPDSYIFHAGTKLDEYVLRTQGGRVFAVTALQDSPKEALQLCRQLAHSVQFDKKYFRNDIGFDLYPEISLSEKEHTS
ncbi:MAG: phosphoribosylamine--glycine ligase [Saprospiraceae bacterium]|nr:phosphoribosylamine--glycine ligase [Saprospiraceae bacterium]